MLLHQSDYREKFFAMFANSFGRPCHRSTSGDLVMSVSWLCLGRLQRPGRRGVPLTTWEATIACRAQIASKKPCQKAVNLTNRILYKLIIIIIPFLFGLDYPVRVILPGSSGSARWPSAVRPGCIVRSRPGGAGRAGGRDEGDTGRAAAGRPSGRRRAAPSGGAYARESTAREPGTIFDATLAGKPLRRSVPGGRPHGDPD